MMKKLIKCTISLVLCLSLLVTPIGVFAETSLVNAPITDEEIEAGAPTVALDESVRGTMPRPSLKYPSTLQNIGTLAESITPSMKATARGVYEAILSAPVEIFDWTNRGIIESTRMNSTSEYEYVARLARDLTSSCKTTDEKIRTLAEYLAKNIGYDHDYFTHGAHAYPPIDPYTVLQNGYTVCSGYAKTYEAMLQSLGIPCIYVYSPDHEWSAVYNGERWMLIDVTWMSNSNYEYERLWKSNVINEDWYDFTIEEALAEYYHVIEEAALGVVDGMLVSYPVYSELSYIHWPAGVSGIGDYVFMNRDHFTDALTIPDTVQTIGYVAFYDCDGFTGGLKLPEALTFVDELAFYNCSGFTGSLTFGNNLKTIGPWAFAYSNFTGDLALPDSLEVIEEDAFYNCDGMTGKLTFGKNIKKIGTWAFASCNFTGDLAFPNSLERIENNAFYYSKFSGKLDLGEGVKYIGEDAFIDCRFTGDLVIPDSVTEIGGLAFTYCTFDGEIKLGKNLKTVGKYAFYACESLKGDLVIPDSVTSIGEGSFSYVGITGDIVIGKGITSIPRDAFYAVQYSYGDIIISENVKTIGERAFQYCSRMRNVYFMGNAPTMFEATDASASFGPYQTTLNYQLGTTGWTDSSNYNVQQGTWMGYPLAVWKYVEGGARAVVYGKIETYNPSVQTTVTLVCDGEVVYTYTIAAIGGYGKVTQDFSIAEVEEGEYDLVVTKAGHLSYTIVGITVDGVDVKIEDALVLVAGDVNGDGRVDLKDITSLTSSSTYGLSYSNAQTKSADINGDKCFDLKDLAIITSETNYGKAPIVVEYQ